MKISANSLTFNEFINKPGDIFPLFSTREQKYEFQKQLSSKRFAAEKRRRIFMKIIFLYSNI